MFYVKTGLSLNCGFKKRPLWMFFVSFQLRHRQKMPRHCRHCRRQVATTDRGELFSCSEIRGQFFITRVGASALRRREFAPTRREG
jgi:hypothetical protein